MFVNFVSAIGINQTINIRYLIGIYCLLNVKKKVTILYNYKFHFLFGIEQDVYKITCAFFYVMIVCVKHFEISTPKIDEIDLAVCSFYLQVPKTHKPIYQHIK